MFGSNYFGEPYFGEGPAGGGTIFTKVITITVHSTVTATKLVTKTVKTTNTSVVTITNSVLHHLKELIRSYTTSLLGRRKTQELNGFDRKTTFLTGFDRTTKRFSE